MYPEFASTPYQRTDGEATGARTRCNVGPESCGLSAVDPTDPCANRKLGPYLFCQKTRHEKRVQRDDVRGSGTEANEPNQEVLVTDASNGAEPLRVAVVDDDDLSRKRIRDLLADREECRLVAEIGDATEAARAIMDAEPDLLFLDIEMPEMDGFELLSQLEAPRPYVIVMTAHEAYAVRGYDEDAVDFLLKPFDRERFDRALDRGAERVQAGKLGVLVGRLRDVLSPGKTSFERRRAGGMKQDEPLERLVVKSQDKKRLVDTEDIRWIEAADYYARIHTTSRSHLLRKSLNWLEEHLDQTRFVRIHRSSIVNVDHVREIVPWSGGSYNVLLDDGTELRLTASRKAELERLLGQSL